MFDRLVARPGTPEGVMRDHRSFLYLAWRNARNYALGTEDRLSLSSGVGIGRTITSIFAALLNGATLCAYQFRKMSVQELIQWLIQKEIAVFDPSIPLFRQILDTLTGQELFPNLRLINVGGQPLYKHDVERFQRLFPPHCTLIYRLASGVPVERILQDVMGLPTTRDPEVQEEIDQLWEWIYQGNFERPDFKRQYDELEQLLGTIDEDLLLMKMEIGKKKWEKEQQHAQS